MDTASLTSPAAALSRHTIGDLLRRSRQRFPDRLAIRCGSVNWTYARFDDICNALAAGLAAEGVALGDRVAVLARNSHAFAALRFALARLGAVLVPINFMLNADEAAYILRARRRHGCWRSTPAWPTLGRDAAARDTRVERLVWLPSESRREPVARA